MDAGLWTRAFGHQWLAGGHLKDVGSERQFCPSNGCPDPSPFNLYPVWPGERPRFGYRRGRSQTVPLAKPSLILRPTKLKTSLKEERWMVGPTELSACPAGQHEAS
jgi:hypothetical protein